MASTSTSGQVVSVLPGRVRLRLHPPHRAQLRKIKEHLAEQQGISHVSVNPTTGSILVHGDPHGLSSENIIGMLRDLGIFVAGVEESADVLSLLGHGDIADSVVTSVDDLNRRLSALVGGEFDLKVIAPLAIGAVGLRQILVAGMGQVTGFLMVWVAFDMYYKLHRPPGSRRGAGQTTSAKLTAHSATPQRA